MESASIDGRGRTRDRSVMCGVKLSSLAEGMVSPRRARGQAGVGRCRARHGAALRTSGGGPTGWCGGQATRMRSQRFLQSRPGPSTSPRMSDARAAMVSGSPRDRAASNGVPAPSGNGLPPGPNGTAALARIEALVDPRSFRPWRSAVGDGVIAGFARVGGRPLCVWTQDGTLKGGSLGAAGGETIVRTIPMANRAGVPVAGFPHSGGARLQEGVAALSAYVAIFPEQSRARVLHLTVIAGP